MKFEPRPFQQVGIDHAVKFLLNAKHNERQAYAAPTGVGKSVVELGVQQQIPDCWIVTPRDEIVDGLLDKLGVPGTDPLESRISTPVKLRNRLFSGALSSPPRCIIFDEAHHHNAETWQQLDLLTGLAPCVCYTATPYRGTPKGTREWLDRWGEPLWLISFEEACREEYIRLPTFETLPLVDDDIIQVTSSGEFLVTAVESATESRLSDMAAYCKRWYGPDGWDRSTLFAMPSTLCCKLFMREMALQGIPVATISSDTPKSERRDIFKLCRERVVALLHINIVTEGVDEPFRRYVDLAPTMSPVNWVQKLGRITRPGTDATPEYICTNRNLLRHAYALNGCVPISAIVQAEQAFPQSTRKNARVLGLEALGRFKPTSVKLADGTSCDLYNLSTIENQRVIKYACIVRPTMDAVWVKCEHAINDDRTRVWGKWEQIHQQPTDLVGFSSVPAKAPSPKQMSWWQRSVNRFGIDSTFEPDKKQFELLPILNDIGGWPL